VDVLGVGANGGIDKDVEGKFIGVDFGFDSTAEFSQATRCSLSTILTARDSMSEARAKRVWETRDLRSGMVDRSGRKWTEVTSGTEWTSVKMTLLLELSHILILAQPGR
jgi:hypothetical protein